MSSRNDVERGGEDQVEREQLEPFEPVALAVDATSVTVPTDNPMAAISNGVEHERHRPPEERRDEDEHRRDHQRDLRAAADGDFERQRHLIVRRGRNRAVVLGGVADQRDDDDAGEELGHAEDVQGRLERADQDLGFDGRQHRGDGQQG